MQSTFAMGDKDKNGRLDSQEIHTALLAGGFQMSYQTRLVPTLLPEEVAMLKQSHQSCFV